MAIAPSMRWRTPGSTLCISLTRNTTPFLRSAKRKPLKRPLQGTNLVKRVVILCAVGGLVGGALLLGQQIPEPRKQFGAGVTGAFERWYNNPDGRAGASSSDISIATLDRTWI